MLPDVKPAHQQPKVDVVVEDDGDEFNEDDELLEKKVQVTHTALHCHHVMHRQNHCSSSVIQAEPHSKITAQLVARRRV